MATENKQLPKARQALVDRVLEELEQGKLPWDSGMVVALPQNLISQKQYRGINLMSLYLTALKRGVTDPRWATFNQISEAGYKVKRGAKGVPIEFYKRIDKRTGKEVDYDAIREEVKDMSYSERYAFEKENIQTIVRSYYVFNGSDVEGLEPYKPYIMNEKEKARRNERIEEILAESEAPIFYDGLGRNYYDHLNDEIHLTDRTGFKTMESYYLTALHELGHSTGHASRLNRKFGESGDEAYAREELVAELTSVFSSAELGLSLSDREFRNSAAYIQAWKEIIQEHPQTFIDATFDANRAADYLYNADRHKQKNNADAIENKTETKSNSVQDSEDISTSDVIYGIVYNWKGLKEENSIYTAKELAALDENFLSGASEYEGAFAANKTYTAYKLSMGSENETKSNIRNFLLGKYNGEAPHKDWYWETVKTNLFTGEDNVTTLKYIKRFNLSDKDLIMNAENVQETTKGGDGIISAKALPGHTFEVMRDVRGLINYTEYDEHGHKIHEVEHHKSSEYIERYYDYNAAGQMTRSYSPNDNDIYTEYQYDDQGRLIRTVGVVKIDGEERSLDTEWYDYDVHGNMIHYKTGDDYEEWREYDEHNNKVRMKNNINEWREYEYDDRGNMIHTYDNHGTHEWYEYNEKGQRIHYAGGSIDSEYRQEEWYDYDTAGRVTHVKTNDDRYDEIYAYGATAEEAHMRLQEAIKDNNIPEAMRVQSRWCAFKAEKSENGKTVKQLFDCNQSAPGSRETRYLKWAKSTELETWTTYETAKKFAKLHKLDGVAFALSGSGITCIDLDHSIDEQGNVSPFAQKVLKVAGDTYTERSVSGRGIHVFYAGSAPENYLNRNDKIDLEVYDSKRFMCVTGDARNESKTRILPPTQELTDLLKENLGKAVQYTQPTQSLNLTDSQLIEKIRGSRKGGEFDRLWAGEDIKGNRSVSDMALCNMLAFFSSGDAEQVERVFRASGMYRPSKGDGYVKRTAEKACATLTKTYNPASYRRSGRTKGASK